MLLCPVCLTRFEGRILQCSLGHAVCEKCQTRLTDCPHCRSPFIGTRNYILEELMARFKKTMKQDKGKGSPNAASPSAASPSAAVQSATNAEPNNANKSSQPTSAVVPANAAAPSSAAASSATSTTPTTTTPTAALADSAARIDSLMELLTDFGLGTLFC